MREVNRNFIIARRSGLLGLLGVGRMESVATIHYACEIDRGSTHPKAVINFVKNGEVRELEASAAVDVCFRVHQDSLVDFVRPTARRARYFIDENGKGFRPARHAPNPASVNNFTFAPATN